MVAVDSPFRQRRMRLTYVVLAPPLPQTKMSAGSAFSSSQGSGEVSLGIVPRGATEVTWMTSVKIVYDVRRQTVSVGTTTVPAAEGSIYLVRVDEQWQPHLTVDDGAFRSPEIPPDIGEELRVTLSAAKDSTKK